MAGKSQLLFLDASNSRRPPTNRFIWVYGYTNGLDQEFSVMVMLWDVFSSFRTELELIWRAPNTPAKIVFLTNRYLTLLVGVIGLAYWSAVREVGESTFCQVILWIPLIFTIVILFTHFVLVVQ